MLLQEIDGYTHDIPQDFLLGDLGEDWLQQPQRPPPSDWPKARIRDGRNKLTAKQLVEMGEVAHKLRIAIRADKEDRNRKPLQLLGFNNRTAAAKQLSRLARTGRLVWATDFFKYHLPYIDACRRMIMTAPLHIYPYVLQFDPDQTNSTQTIHLLKWGGSILAESHGLIVWHRHTT
jgi:hypothetical protein